MVVIIVLIINTIAATCGIIAAILCKTTTYTVLNSISACLNIYWMLENAHTLNSLIHANR